MVDVALRSYFMTPESEAKLNNPEEVQETIRVLQVSKDPDTNGIPKRALASPKTSGIPPGPDFQRDPPHPSLHYSVEKRSVDHYT
jgi:hypothetical protein